MNWDIYTFISFGVLGEYAKSLFASSTCTHRSFPRILQVRRKNDEYAERNFHFQQCLGTSKGQCFEKGNEGLYACLGWTVYKKIFLVIYKTKTALCVYGDYAKQRNIS